jgi:hypothetical protein
MTVAATSTAYRCPTGAEAMTMAVADALPFSVQVPEVVTLVLVVRGGIARAEQRQRGHADRKHRELPCGSSSDADEMTARGG